MNDSAESLPGWDPLEPLQRRILGVLIEKSKTTPDTYPLSLNALTTGCNQKSNRDPVMDLEEEDVENAIAPLQKRGLASRVSGGRVDRWRHHAYEAWTVGRIELGILCELLLRGPQTEGELRTRVARLDTLPDGDTLGNALKELARRALVVWLEPEGRRGARVTHGFHPPAELEALKAGSGSPTAIEQAPRAADPGLLARVEALEARVEELARQFAEFRKAVGG
ncbi:MAG: YceH family protein [Planctomycetota bacterium]